jgi:hypothetical protein
LARTALGIKWLDRLEYTNSNQNRKRLPEHKMVRKPSRCKKVPTGDSTVKKIQGTLCFASFIAAAIAGGGLEESSASISWYWFGIFLTTTIFLLPRRQQFSSRKGNNK